MQPAPYKLDTKPLSCFAKDGMATGLTWNSPWRPGGPFVFSDFSNGTDPEWMAYCALSRERRRVWLEAFDSARALVS